MNNESNILFCFIAFFLFDIFLPILGIIQMWHHSTQGEKWFTFLSHCVAWLFYATPGDYVTRTQSKRTWNQLVCSRIISSVTYWESFWSVNKYVLTFCLAYLLSYINYQAPVYNTHGAHSQAAGMSMQGRSRGTKLSEITNYATIFKPNGWLFYIPYE